MITEQFRKKYRLTKKQQEQMNVIIRLERDAAYSDGQNAGEATGRKRAALDLERLQKAARLEALKVVTESTRQHGQLLSNLTQAMLSEAGQL